MEFFLLIIILNLAYLGGSFAGTDSIAQTANYPTKQEMWREIQRLRNMVNQETDLRLSFEQNFLTHLISLQNLEKRFNSDLITAKQENQESRLSAIEKELETAARGLEDVNNKTNTLISGRTEPDQQKTISFSANLKSSVTLSSDIVFNEVLVNNGGGYNPSTGKFTCPQTGTYFFAVKFLTNKSGLTELGFTVNRNTQAYARAYDKSYYQTSGEGTFMFNLQKGDEVSMSAIGSVKLYGSPSVRFTTFMGMLVSS